MKIIDIYEAIEQLEKLVDQAAAGEPFMIAIDGKPMVRVEPLDLPAVKNPRRMGFLKGQFTVPDDFDTMYSEEIEKLFYGEE